MKTRNGLEGHTTFTAGSRDSLGQDRLLRQIKTLTKEIDALQTEITRMMRSPDGISQRSSGENASVARVLAQFKLSLDRLRHVLWLYIEQLACQAGANIINGEPLRLGQPPGPACAVSSKPTREEAYDPLPGSFFDRLDVVVASYVKRATGPSGTRKRAKL